MRYWTVAAVLAAAGVVISINFLDKPIAWFFYGVLAHLMVLKQFSATPSFFGPFALLILMIFFVRRIARYPLSRPDAALILCGASILTSKWLVSLMKFLFGRTWPLYGRPSLLLDGAYGFNFLTAGQESSFPSGHIATLCALTGILWAMYPKYKLLYAVGNGAIAVVLVSGDFHFLSDVIAGGFLGSTIAVVTLGASNFVKLKLKSTWVSSSVKNA